MVMNIFTSFFSLCYRHRKPCQHCSLQSSPQTLLQWLDTPAFQRKGSLEKVKEWLSFLVDHVLWGCCLPVWLSFNLLAGINPPLLVWSCACCLCCRAGAGSAAAPVPVPTLRPLNAMLDLSRLWERFTAQTAQSAHCAPTQGSAPLFFRVGISKGWQDPAPIDTLSNQMPNTIQYWEATQGFFALSYRVKDLPWSLDTQFFFQFREGSGPGLSAVTQKAQQSRLTKQAKCKQHLKLHGPLLMGLCCVKSQ